MVNENKKGQSPVKSSIRHFNDVMSTSFSSFDAVPIEALESYMNISYPYTKRAEFIKNWEAKTASDDMIARDLVLSNYSTLLPATQLKFNKMSAPRLGANLAPRTTAGHAHAAHAGFSGKKKFTNTDLSYIITDDVLSRFNDPTGKPYYGGRSNQWVPFSEYKKLGTTSKSPKVEFLEETQDMINSVVHLFEHAINSRSKTSSLNNFRQHELINSFIPGYISKVDNLGLLVGGSFGGNFDNYTDIRKPAEGIYDVTMGGGHELLLDVEQAKRYSIGFGELASTKFEDGVLREISFEQRIELFKRLQIMQEHSLVKLDGVKSWNDVLAQGKDMRNENKLVPVYVREKNGSGVSDDGACMLVALHDFKGAKQRNGFWYDSLQRGAHLMDAVDTLEKASTYFFAEGQDQIIANYISHKWLDRVRSDKNYRRMHHINLNALEARIEEEGTTNFALFPKQDLIDITAASANPVDKFSGKHIHSSARYFLQSVSFDGNSSLSAGRKKATPQIESNILAQEKIFTQYMLEKLGADVKVDGNYLVPGNLYPDQLYVGFSKIPADDAFAHFEEMAQVIANPATRRANLMNYYKK